MIRSLVSCTTTVLALFILLLCTGSAEAIAAGHFALKPWPSLNLSKSISEKVLLLPVDHPFIKKVKIHDTGEPMVDLEKIDNRRIRSLETLSSRYDFVYPEHSMVRKGVYLRLLRMLEILPEDVGIAYSKGFKPLSQQKESFDAAMRAELSNNKSPREAYKSALQSVSTFIDNIPAHSTGGAIDMMLFRIKEKKVVLLDMGAYGANAGEQSETFARDTTPLQRRNRMMLLKAAVEAGFVNSGFTWWHFSYGDQVWAFINKNSAAIYGMIESGDTHLAHMSKKQYFRSIKRPPRKS